MKNKQIQLIILFMLLGSLLSACGSGAALSTSWPGLSVDPNQDTVYVAHNTFIYALNFSNGSEIWRYPIDADNKVTFFAAPQLTGDGQLVAPSYNASLYSISPENGVLNWRFEGAKSRYISEPLILDDRILASNADNFLYSVSLDGKLQWSFETGHSLWGTPLADGETVYLQSMDHMVYGLKTSSGELLWKSGDLGGAITAQPVLNSDGLLFVGTFGNKILALDTKKQGEIVWEKPTGGWIWSAPLLQEGILYVGDLAGNLFAIEAATGVEKWKFSPTDLQKPAISGTPAILGDTLYFVTEGGSLYALDKLNGGQKWVKQFAVKFYPGPLVIDDTILLAPIGGEELVIALDSVGNQKWVFIPVK